MQENYLNKITNSDLSNLRIIGMITGSELFGNERDNIEIYISLRYQGAKVILGINQSLTHGDTKFTNLYIYLKELEFETFNIPWGNQWSLRWLRLYPLSIFEKINQLWSSSRQLLRQIKIFKPTHIQINSFMGYNYVAPALFFANVPLIYRMGEVPPLDSVYSLQVWKLAMKQSSKVVAVSEFVRQEILSQDISPSKVEKIYNLAPSRLTLSNSPIENTDRTGLVYVGQLSESKGLWQLLQAFFEVQGCDLKIVGGSRYETTFKHELEAWVKSNHLQDRVHFLGYADDPTIFYETSLIHIAPSLVREGLGMIVLEAKKSGTPSIVFPSGGLPEMVRHCIDGYVCRDKTPEALLEAIQWMLSDRDRLAQMSRAARVDYEIRFGQQRFLKEWSRVYLSVKY
jgi:glycosyltransferase involved in cell wall biosynthesis